jgi:LCP family protein required for cell wall assembly
MPWQLPVAAVLAFLALLLAIVRPSGRANSDAPSDVNVRQPSAQMTPELAAALTPTAGGEPGVVTQPEITPFPTFDGDPLDDPSLQNSELEEANHVNILLLGTDGRDEEDGPPRTDLMMLLVLDRESEHATLISIPRDLWVPIPGYGEGKINTAYFLGSLEDRGAEVAKETVEDLVGMQVDHIVEVDFDGFRTLIDEMGGISVNVPEAIDDPLFPDSNYGYMHLQIPAGPQQMNGETALQYARTRYGGVDQDRSARQQLVLMAIRDRALEPSVLAQAPRHLRTVYRLVNSDLSLGDIFSLARFGRSLNRDSISMHTLNGDLTWSAYTWNGQDALMYDPEQLHEAIEAWINGETYEVEATPDGE